MEIKELKEKLKPMECGMSGYFTHPKRMPPTEVDGILNELGCREQIGENWNGCDLDWFNNIEFEGMKILAVNNSRVFRSQI